MSLSVCPQNKFQYFFIQRVLLPPLTIPMISSEVSHIFVISYLDYGGNFLTDVPISSGHSCPLSNSDPSCTQIDHIVFLSSCHFCGHDRLWCLPGVGGVICRNLGLAIRDPLHEWNSPQLLDYIFHHSPSHTLHSRQVNLLSGAGFSPPCLSSYHSFFLLCPLSCSYPVLQVQLI